MADFYYDGMWRMDWGLGNPNKTAALIAMLMVAVWALAGIRRWGFWAALVLFTGLGVCLVATYSRGGLVAAVVGLLPLAWMAKRPWARRRVVVLAGAAVLLAACAIGWDAHARYGQGIRQPDASIANRLALWQAAPMMMADAPGGWGWGQAGRAYLHWYQPGDRDEAYRTLVNSHLTWMVEGGWAFRLAYAAAWGVVLLLCWPGPRAPGLAVPLGVWLAFGVAAFFSSVAESPWLWGVPGLSLLAVICYRWARADWPGPLAWSLPPAVAVITCGLLHVAGQAGDSGIHGGRGRVVLGQGEPGLWILADEGVMGARYGQPLRRHLPEALATYTAVGVVTSPDRFPPLTGKTVVLAGRQDWVASGAIASNLRQARQLILLNPRFYPVDVKLEAGTSPPVQVVAGAFSQNPALALWRDHYPQTLLPAMGDYFPDWPTAVLGSATVAGGSD